MCSSFFTQKPQCDKAQKLATNPTQKARADARALVRKVVQNQ
jgi:hypothetical protein